MLPPAAIGYYMKPFVGSEEKAHMALGSIALGLGFLQVRNVEQYGCRRIAHRQPAAPVVRHALWAWSKSHALHLSDVVHE